MTSEDLISALDQIKVLFSTPGQIWDKVNGVDDILSKFKEYSLKLGPQYVNLKNSVISITKIYSLEDGNFIFQLNAVQVAGNWRQFTSVSKLIATTTEDIIPDDHRFVYNNGEMIVTNDDSKITPRMTTPAITITPPVQPREIAVIEPQTSAMFEDRIVKPVQGFLSDLFDPFRKLTSQLTPTNPDFVPEVKEVKEVKNVEQQTTSRFLQYDNHDNHDNDDNEGYWHKHCPNCQNHYHRRGNHNYHYAH
jgi:hypothetical protein